MRKGLGWFGLRQDSVGGNQRKQRQELRQPNEPEDGEQLCGVGIVLFKAPDNSLFIKVSTLELCTLLSVSCCGVTPALCGRPWWRGRRLATPGSSLAIVSWR